VPIHDDEQFEKYLKQFRPVPPEPLTVKEQVRARPRRLVIAAWAAVAVVIVVAVILSIRLYQRPSPVQEAGAGGPRVEPLNGPQPLTIASANALLAGAPSFKAAVESVVFRSGAEPVAEGKHSALALLSKEKIKL
jgi:hypothetical protein